MDAPAPLRPDDDIEIIELGRIDDEVAAFPSESAAESSSTVASSGEPESAERPRDDELAEFPTEHSLLGERLIPSGAGTSDRSHVPSVMAPPRRRFAGPGRALVAVAAIVIGITGAIELAAFVRSLGQRAVPSPTRPADVASTAEATRTTSADPLTDLPRVFETATSPLVRSTETREERTAPPQRPQVVGRSVPATASRPAAAPALPSWEIVAPNASPPSADDSSRTVVDGAASPPGGTANAATDASERPRARPAAANIVAEGRSPAVPVVTPVNEVQRALAQYQNAFSQLDVAAVRQVWPTANEKALTKAFDQLLEENLTFDSCTVTVTGQTAVAVCEGTTQYVPKVGNKSARFERRQWRFALRQVTEAWVIDSIELGPG